MHFQAWLSARLLSWPILQPGSSYHLKMSHATAPEEQQKTAAMMRLLNAIGELLPGENSNKS